MTTIERIEEVVRIVKEHLDPSLSESDVSFVLSSVLNLGWQWDQANAHAHAAFVIAGQEPDAEGKEIANCIAAADREKLIQMDQTGSNRIFQQAGGILKYTRLVAEFEHFGGLMSIGNRLIPSEAEDNEEKENPKAD